MVLKLIDIKSPTLRQKAKRVQKVDKKIVQLISDMKQTLVAQDDPEGIGLAAPQVGKSFQLFIVNFEGLERVIINPKIISLGKIKKTKSKKKDKTLEGCLSLPHYYGPIKRPDEITIEYTNELAQHKQEKFEGFPAHIIQHEMDHLTGRLFIDHIIEQDAPLYKIQGDEWEEVELI
jgi:peptide deformylase